MPKSSPKWDITFIVILIAPFFLTTGKYWVLSVRHECRAISEYSGGLERG